jgi:hypothetical protein
MGMFGKALELLVDELGPDEGKSEVLRAFPAAIVSHWLRLPLYIPYQRAVGARNPGDATDSDSEVPVPDGASTQVQP